jgi:transcriptional regulator with XRE-family HTH domain
MDTRTRISWNLRRLRTAQQLTQENLAVDASVDRTVISDIERGKHNASIDLLDRIAAALDVDILEFFLDYQSTDIQPGPLKPGRKPRAHKPTK